CARYGNPYWYFDVW
nr:immunoglobulin heavy chain junction region [Mus musculus]